MVNFGILGYLFYWRHDIIESWKGREKTKTSKHKTIKLNILIVMSAEKITRSMYYDLYNIRKV